MAGRKLLIKSAMQYNPVTILSTRPLPCATIQQAARRNISIETISFITTEAINDPRVNEAVQRLTGMPVTAVFTSMNAVEAVAEKLQGQQPAWRIFTLGTATTSIAKEKFPHSSISGGGENASALADRIMLEPDIKSVIFFCGEQRRDELPTKLQEHNIEVKEIRVYKTINLLNPLTKTYDGIMFFSPSAVESFFRSNTPSPSTILFAIGGTTAAAIEQYAPNKVITSDRPGKEALVDKVVSYFNTINQQR
jgi:uroporphyrinogen-III synthase